MQFVKFVKQWRKTIIVLLLITALGIFLRVFNLTRLPVFGDEAIYIRWSQIMRSEPTLRFLPLSDGKQPLFMWVMMPFLKIFEDPLFAGRFVSVLTGLETAFGIFTLSYLLYKSKKAAIISYFVYMVTPFGYFFDRLALADSMLASFGVWSVVFSVMLVRQLKLDLSMILGFVLGAALLTKSPALFFSILIPSTLVLGDFIKKKNLHRLPKAIIFLVISYLIAYGGYNFILRLGPNFHMIAARNLDYVFPISHIWSNPKDPFIFHFERTMQWYFIYGTLGMYAMFVLSFLQVKKYFRQSLVVLSFMVLPLLVQSMFAKVFTTRYIFFTFAFYSIFCGLGFVNFDVKQLLGKVKIFLILAVIAQSAYFFFRFQTNLELTPLARTDRSGFLEEWTSGTGIRESADYIINIYKSDSDKKIVVGTEGYFGTLPDGFAMYTANYPITVIGVGLDLHDIPQSLGESVASGNKTYLVINSSRLKMNIDDPRLKLIKSFRKAVRPDFTREYSLYGSFDTLYLFEILAVTSNNDTR